VYSPNSRFSSSLHIDKNDVDQKRLVLLDELANEAQENGMGY